MYRVCLCFLCVCHIILDGCFYDLIEWDRLMMFINEQNKV